MKRSGQSTAGVFLYIFQCQSAIMPNKNLCNKCGKRHFPPTGKKCKYAKAVLSNSDNDSYVMPDSGVPVSKNSSKKDSQVMSQGSVPVQKTKKNATSIHSSDTDGSNSSEAEDSISLKISQQLKRVNSRLDAVEDQVAAVKTDYHQKRHKGKHEQSKLSKKRGSYQSVKNPVKSSIISSTESDSDIDSDASLLNLSTLKSSIKIQWQVDSRLRELELLQNHSGKDYIGRIKSKRGGPVEVVVKHKVAWPHEAILGSINRMQVTYDQLSLPQWVQVFCRNILDEQDNGK